MKHPYLSFFFGITLLLIIGFMFALPSCKDETIEPECTNSNGCSGGYECLNGDCICPEGYVQYGPYCADLNTTNIFMSRNGCECQDSLLWWIDSKPPVPNTAYIRTILVPIHDYPTLQFSHRIAIFGQGNNPDSFIVIQNAVTVCDTALIDPNAKVAYASGVFTSDSTGIMHLDWYNIQDTVPYRRCSMPFTRIR